jgi:hypothetical protein
MSANMDCHGALKMLRTKLIATIALTLLIGSTVAIAQTKGAGSPGAASSKFDNTGGTDWSSPTTRRSSALRENSEKSE